MSSQPFPKFHELLRPMLVACADGEPHSVKEIIEKMMASSGLSEEQLAETIPSGQPRYRNRSLWAATYLRKCQALTTPRRGWVQLGDCGRELLSENAPITMGRLRQIPGWEEAWGTRRSDQESTDNSSLITVVEDEEATPEERITAGIEQLESDVRGDLLQRVKTISPAAFEGLVLQLLGALGYGVGPESRRGVSLGPDGGLDGRIHEDRLGLASIYIQAKRYQEQTIGRPVIQAFYGAMGGVGANKGVFITTSSFSREARDYADALIDKRIVLIDGSRLTQLMLDAGVGVSVKHVYKVHRLDEDFFAEFEGI
jgi:restriction system protein